MPRRLVDIAGITPRTKHVIDHLTEDSLKGTHYNLHKLSHSSMRVTFSKSQEEHSRDISLLAEKALLFVFRLLPNITINQLHQRLPKTKSKCGGY